LDSSIFWNPQNLERTVNFKEFVSFFTQPSITREQKPRCSRRYERFRRFYHTLTFWKPNATIALLLRDSNAVYILHVTSHDTERKQHISFSPGILGISEQAFLSII
jgi:hypothetical protein